jgi:hypothetical protein
VYTDIFSSASEQQERKKEQRSNRRRGRRSEAVDSTGKELKLAGNSNLKKRRERVFDQKWRENYSICFRAKLFLIIKEYYVLIFQEIFAKLSLMSCRPYGSDFVMTSIKGCFRIGKEECLFKGT